MGLVNEIPVYEDTAFQLKPEDVKDPNTVLDKTLNTFRVSRRFSLDPHNKQHLFGKGHEKPVEPRNQRLYQ
jgi:hypothetical protein